MPIYEYRCTACKRRSSLFFRSIGSVEADPACPHCGERTLTRRMSRVWSHSSRGGAGVDSDAFDPAAALGGPPGDWYGDDEWGDTGMDADEDPISMAREMRSMAAMTGEPLDPGLDRALSHIEAGADPDEVLGELDASEEAAGGDPPSEG